MISLKDGSLSLDGNAGRVDILHGITLDVQRGQTLGLVGPSGSGKSSLLMLMGGLERATGGTVTALGHDLTTMSEDALARLRRDHIGVVFQSFHLIPTMTALENVATPLELAGKPDAQARAAGVMLLPAAGFDVVPSDVLVRPARAGRPGGCRGLTRGARCTTCGASCPPTPR